MPLQPTEFDITHIRRLTNNVGICQHASFNIPNYHHGYCLDDNARALQLVVFENYFSNANKHNDLIDTYLAYILYMQKSDGKFHNFLGYNMQFLDIDGTPDAFGRTIMALGSVLLFDQTKLYLPLSIQIFNNAKRHIKELKSVRAIAYTLIGLIWIQKSPHYNEDLTKEIVLLADSLQSEYFLSKDIDWYWYEQIITYDNGIIPYALLLAYDLIKYENYKYTAIESITFLDKLLFKNGYLKLIGNDGWLKKGSDNVNYGEQPIEIPSLILMYNLTKKIDPNLELLGNANKSYNWFFAQNHANLILYNNRTKGCFDGLEKDHVNQNQGAESTLAFWQATLYHKYQF